MAIPEPKFEVDLLEGLLTSFGDNLDRRIAKQRVYNDILDNQISADKESSKDHPYSMYQKKGGAYRYKAPDLACAPAVKAFCNDWLGGIYDDLKPYYGKPPPKKAVFNINKIPTRPNRERELVFPQDLVRAGYNRITYILRKIKKPVLVGLIRGCGDDIGIETNKYVAYHYVGIVGFGEQRFLYIDPLPGGSSTAVYKGARHNMMGYIILRTPPGRPNQLALVAEDLWVSKSQKGAVVLCGPM